MVFNIDLRILNWNYGGGSDLMNIPYSYHHLLRIFQLARLLSRDANIMKILISKGGVQIILNMIMHLHPKVLENLGHNETPYTPLLIEVISTAKRMHVYILEHYTETVDDADLLIDAPTKEDNITIIERTLPLLTDLLCCDNNILQICIIELIIQILSKRTNIEYFRNDQALENILAVLNNSDEVELKKRVLCLLIELMNDDQVLAILKDLNVLEVLANQLEQIRLINIHCEDDEPSEETSNMKVGFWDAFRVLSHITHDLLPEFRRLHIIGTLLDELELSKRVFPQMTLLEILTNLCMDDQNAVMIRE